MLHEVKLNLTYAGRCVNPMCRAPLYKELMREWDQEACGECDPPNEEIPTAFRLSFVSCDGLPVCDSVACVACGALWARHMIGQGQLCAGGCIWV